MLKSKRIIVFLGVILMLVLGGTAVAATKVMQKSIDNIDDGSMYTSYHDDSETKERIKNICFEGKNISISYVRTENLKEKPVSQRKSSYGTYDIYVDDEETEYLFLMNTELFCGYKKSVVGIPLPQNEAILEEDATQLCENYIEENRSNSNDYRLSDCFYDERAGYYDCEYSLYWNDVKTDDVLRIWVNSEGVLTAVSEFNRERYALCNVTVQKCAEARKRAIDEFSVSNPDVDYAEADSFLSQNDEAEWVYVIFIDIKVPCDKGTYVVQRERLEESIE